MDYFGFDGALSDEIILNVLLQIPGAGSFLSFGSTCQRLRDLCRFEEDRYHVWRNWKELYRSKSQVAKTILADSHEPTRTALGNIFQFDRLPAEGKSHALELLSTYLFNLDTSTLHKKKFFELMGPHQLLYCVACSEDNPVAQAAALMLLFRLIKDDDKMVRDALPIGSISVLTECLNSTNAECRRGALGLLWLFSLHEEDQCLHFGKLGVVDALIKLLYSDVTPALLCSVTILCKCVSEDSIQKMKNQDILPRLIDLVDFEEHSIKCGAMRLLPKFDRQRVAELGGMNKLVKVVQDYHDKIESVTMMALIVLEYLSQDDQNKSLMGRDDTISVMISMLSSEKSELQKQAMLILTSISKLDINARKIRQQSGLDALVNILDKSDLPDVQHSVLHAIVDTSSDIIESGTLDSLEAMKRLELSLPKLCEMLSSKNLHAIVREAAAGALELCVIVLSLNPRQVQDIVRASIGSIETALHPDASLPSRAFKSLYQMLSVSVRLLARAFENFPSSVIGEDLEDTLASMLPQLFSALESPMFSTPNLDQNLCWLFSFLCQSEKLCTALSSNVAAVERLLRPLVTDGDSVEARLRAALLASYLTIHHIPVALQEDVSRKALATLETTSTNCSMFFRLFSVAPYIRLLESPNSLKPIGMWFSASVSHSAQGRRRVKQVMGSHVLDEVRQQAPYSPILQSLLTSFDKNMSVSSVFA